MLPADARRQPLPNDLAEKGLPFDVWQQRFEHHKLMSLDHVNWLRQFIARTYFEPAGLQPSARFHEVPDVSYLPLWFWGVLLPVTDNLPHPPWLIGLCADLCEFARLNNDMAYAGFFLADYGGKYQELVRSYFTPEAQEAAKEIIHGREEAHRRRQEESGY